MKNIVVLVSGGGTNLQALIDAQNRGEIVNGRISCVISSKEGAYALERAAKDGIPSRVIPRSGYESREAYSKAILDALREEKADLVILAGFMIILDESVPAAFPNQILNVHPALIPSFCGPGYYGLKVHEAALEAGVKVTGATVHFVSAVCDGGPIILQEPVACGKQRHPRDLAAPGHGAGRVENPAPGCQPFLSGEDHRPGRPGVRGRITGGHYAESGNLS